MRAGHAAPEWLRARLQREDPGAVVGEVGLAGRDPVCVDALDLLITIYGGQAGNLALEGLALGGLIVGGGIAPKIQAKLGDGRFMKAFRDKGRLDTLLASVPVRVALDPRAPPVGRRASCHAHAHLVSTAGLVLDTSLAASLDCDRSPSRDSTVKRTWLIGFGP
jgi:Glucokinase